MVDLQSDKSIVRNLLARGEDVYIIVCVGLSGRAIVSEHDMAKGKIARNRLCNH